MSNLTPSVAMLAPAGFFGSVSVNVSTPPTSGLTYTPDVNGQILVAPADILFLMAQGFTVASFPTGQKIATADNGTTQTLTAAMLSGGGEVYHTSAGGATPSLTLPLAADFIAANKGLAIGKSMKVRIINTNSGIATIVTNTGWTMTGTLTLAANTWREFVVTMTGAATLTAVQVGTGTNS